MMLHKTIASLVLLLFAASPTLLAAPQGGGPQGGQKIEEMLEKIRNDMRVIDKLLDQAASKASSGRSGGSGSSGSSSGGSGSSGGASSSAAGGDSLDKILEKSVGASKSVVDQIDKLLEQAQQNQNQNQSQSQSQSSQRQPKDGQQRRNQQRRPDNRMQETPEMIRQRRERERQQREQRDGKPRGARASQDKKKRQKGARAPNGATERVDKAKQAGNWGKLPPYLQFLFKKSGAPKLPSKYESFREAFHKSADRKKR